MRVMVRRTVEMATRVLEFLRGNPLENPGHAAAVGQLEGLLTRAESLAQQERTGRLTVRAAAVRMEQLRAGALVDFRLLSGLAARAAAEHPAAAARIRVPSYRLNQRAFLSAGRVAVAQAESQLELLSRYGLPEGHLAQITAVLDEFEQLLLDRSGGRSAHVGANAELLAVRKELLAVVQQLDALNQHRFQRVPEKLAAWRSARDVAWPMRKEKAPPMENVGEVKPAA